MSFIVKFHSKAELEKRGLGSLVGKLYPNIETIEDGKSALRNIRLDGSAEIEVASVFSLGLLPKNAYEIIDNDKYKIVNKDEQIASLTDEIIQHTFKNDKLSAENVELVKENAVVVRHNQDLKAQITDLENQILDLQKQLKASAEAVAKAQDQAKAKAQDKKAQPEPQAQDQVKQ